ncbi:hypothetical protein SKA53_06117 [Yoonia vestfoldensis SKA53]|uniref:Uncharacterized protein n=1 Tax=Yoonia vestfoldensis SKA53 TaxID=314232 RepID=A3V7K6_9RHOB|nr:hypothetical protein SKA53_06117 [Yoonia vestfoldensis SKA53]
MLLKKVVPWSGLFSCDDTRDGRKIPAVILLILNNAPSVAI